MSLKYASGTFSRRHQLELEKNDMYMGI